MKVLWLCGMVPGSIPGSTGGALWVDHVLADLRKMPDVSMHVLCMGSREASGETEDGLRYTVFVGGKPQKYPDALEQRFFAVLQSFCPDVIHIWGTEYAHTLALVNAAQKQNLTDRIVISIQGLCSVYARHYAEGVPDRVRYSFTLRDILKQDNIEQQRRSFAQRGALEVEALRQVRHVIGRTPWDEACTYTIHPERRYHFCNETLRDPFYEGLWGYDACTKHRIFASSCVYPIKGFHYLLEALRVVRQVYPDATLTVPRETYYADSLRQKLHQSSYRKYLAELTDAYGLKDAVTFLGKLSAEDMKAAFLDANVFVLPSTVENSPNSLGEAMLLGVPCVAADVGGVSTMLENRKEGYVYPSTEPDLLAHHILQIFAMNEKAAAMGLAAREHARLTHDPEKNMADLLSIYHTIMEGEG